MRLPATPIFADSLQHERLCVVQGEKIILSLVSIEPQRLPSFLSCLKEYKSSGAAGLQHGHGRSSQAGAAG